MIIFSASDDYDATHVVPKGHSGRPRYTAIPPLAQNSAGRDPNILLIWSRRPDALATTLMPERSALVADPSARVEMLDLVSGHGAGPAGVADPSSEFPPSV